MMFSANGRLILTASEQRVDRETGEQKTRHLVQLMGQVPLRDGSGFKNALVEFSVQDLRPYQDLTDKLIQVPIGAFAPAKGEIIYFVPRGAQPGVASQ